MARRRKRKPEDGAFRLPGYDDLADKGRDTGAPSRNRVVIARTDRLDGEDRATVRNYAVDTVTCMLNRGSISVRLAAAGVRFREDFLEAFSSNVPAMDLEQAIGSGGHSPLYPAGGAALVSWGRQVQPALDALGTADSPMRLVAWHVLGCGKSLRGFAETVGWEGRRPRPVMAANGILTSALRALADHYGMEG